MKAVCHIGLPKTGTTTIQSFLQDNAAALDRQGVIYRRFQPRQPIQSEYLLAAFKALGRTFKQPGRQQRLGVASRQELVETVTGFESWIDRQLAGTKAQTWLISCEILVTDLRQPAGVRALHDWLSARFSEVTYVVYLRRQDLWVASFYAQFLRFGETATIEEFAARRPAFDYMQLVELWSSVAGSDRVKVRLLEADALKDGDLLADFCETVGLRPEGLTQPRRLNESFSRRGAEFVRRANLVAARLARPHGLVDRGIRNLARQLASLLLRHGVPLRLPDRLRDQLLAEFAPSNEKLRQLLFPDRHSLFRLPAAAHSSRNPPPETVADPT
jgi:hypothetical protein